MNLLAMLANANGGRNIEALANRFGLSGEQTQSVLGQLLPALSQGVQNNARSEGGGRKSSMVPEPSKKATGFLATSSGGKDASRSLSRQVAGSTGISETMIGQLVPVLASLAMGAMSKKMGSKPPRLT